MKNLDIDVTCGEGKYTVQFGPQQTLRALRYGEEWRDCTGDGLIYYLAVELQETKKKLQIITENIEQRVIQNQTDYHAIPAMFADVPERNVLSGRWREAALIRDYVAEIIET